MFPYRLVIFSLIAPARCVSAPEEPAPWSPSPHFTRYEISVVHVTFSFCISIQFFFCEANNLSSDGSVGGGFQERTGRECQNPAHVREIFRPDNHQRRSWRHIPQSGWGAGDPLQPTPMGARLLGLLNNNNKILAPNESISKHHNKPSTRIFNHFKFCFHSWVRSSPIDR